MLHRPTPDPAPDEQVHRISAAPHAHSDDLSARINRYLVSMAIRTVCVILVVVVDGWLRWVFAVGAIGLPYVAVILANAGHRPREADPDAPTARARGVRTGSADGSETVTVTYPTQPISAPTSTSAEPAASTPVTVRGTVVQTGPQSSQGSGRAAGPPDELP